MLSSRFIQARIMPDPDPILGTVSARQKYILHGVLVPGHHTYTPSSISTNSNHMDTSIAVPLLRYCILHA